MSKVVYRPIFWGWFNLDGNEINLRPCSDAASYLDRYDENMMFAQDALYMMVGERDAANGAWITGERYACDMTMVRRMAPYAAKFYEVSEVMLIHKFRRHYGDLQVVSLMEKILKRDRHKWGLRAGREMVSDSMQLMFNAFKMDAEEVLASSCVELRNSNGA